MHLCSLPGKSHIQVLPDPTGNPHCRSHGPAIVLSESFDDGSPTQTFFACSANRDRHKCPIQTNAKSPTQAQLTEQYELRLAKHSETLNRILASPTTERGYCAECECLVVANAFTDHRGHRGFRRDLSDEQIKCPTTVIAPLDNDVQEAQYFFSEQTLHCLGNIFQKLRLR